MITGLPKNQKVRFPHDSYSVQRYSYSNRSSATLFEYEYEYEYRDAEYDYEPTAET